MTGDKAGEANAGRKFKIPCIWSNEMINMYGTSGGLKKLPRECLIRNKTVSDNTDNKRRENNAQHRYKKSEYGKNRNGYSHIMLLFVFYVKYSVKQDKER